MSYRPNASTASSSSGMINIAPYMSKFVRNLHADEDRPLEIPFHYTQFGVVLMVDIVGFSKMTSIELTKGEVGAEMISSQIGGFMDQAIRIIELHGGDVVKFLGDALLVVFQADPNLERINNEFSPDYNHHQANYSNHHNINGTKGNSKSSESHRLMCLTVRRACQCSLELFSRLSSYRVYLSEREFSRRYSGAEGAGMGININGGPNGGGGLNGMGGGHNNPPLGVLHDGMTSDESMDAHLKVPPGYTAPYQNGRRGSGTGSISPTTSFRGSQKHGSFQVQKNGKEGSIISTSSRPNSLKSRKRRNRILSTAKHFFGGSSARERAAFMPTETSDDICELQMHMAMSAGDVDNIIIGDLGDSSGVNSLLQQTAGRLEYAICGKHMEKIDDALNMARAGELVITGIAPEMIDDIPGSMREPRRGCIVLRNAIMNRSEPVPRRIRNEKLLNTAMESNEHYFKYINKSAIHRLVLYPDSTFPAQFRTVTILFVSLGDIKPWTAEGLDICQRAMFITHRVTSEYEGFIQQFAVDDKGATLLCAFGLPYPRSHEREAVFAAKAAWVIRRRLLDDGINGFKISLATGVIFTSMIGNEFRRDPAIVGDTIVISVRILKFDYAKESVVCDEATMKACSIDADGMCDFQLMGEEYIKGKAHPIKVYVLRHFGVRKLVRKPTDVMIDDSIGYEPEREKVVQFIKSWVQRPKNNTILISGPRGSGKSMFYQQICHISNTNHYSVCTAASAEVEKRTQYYLCKFLLIGMFGVMKKREIPYVKNVRDLGIIMNQMSLGEAGTATSTGTPTITTNDMDTGYFHGINGLSLDSTNEMSTNCTNGVLTNDPITTTNGIHGIINGNGMTANGTSSTLHKESTEINGASHIANRPPHVRSGANSYTNGTAHVTNGTSTGSHNTPTGMSTFNTSTSSTPHLSAREFGFDESLSSPRHPASEKLSVATGSPREFSFSPILNQPDDPHQRRAVFAKSVKSLITTTLDKMGESEALEPMLHNVITLDNSASTLEPVDDEALTGFIIRLLNYASRYVKLIAMFEDVQWCDPQSLNVIKAIHENCPLVLVVLFSRSLRDYGGALYDSLTCHSNHLGIAIDGLKPREVEQVLLKAFAEHGVNKIRPEVVQLVLEKTKGNPKFVKNMANMLKDFSHVNIVENELMTTGTESADEPYKNLDEILENQDRKKMILMQFDRLTPQFQDLLKIASCLGTTFSLSEIAAVRPLESMLGQAVEPGITLPMMISRLDIYRFLSLTTDQQCKVRFSDKPYESTLYTFTTASMSKTIYESIPYEDRVAIHLSMGKFYELFLDPINSQDLLQQITRHYLKTDFTERKIYFLQALAAFDIKSNMLTDAADTLAQLIQLIQTEPGAKDLISDEDLAHVHGLMGESLTRKMRLEEAEPILLESLSMYGIEWPKTQTQWSWMLLKQRAKVQFYYSGGRINHGLPSPTKSKIDRHPVYIAKVGEQRKVTLQRIIRVLVCLQGIYMWKTDPQGSILSILLCLNFCYKLGLPCNELTISLARYAILSYFNGHKRVCDEYLAKANLANEADEWTNGLLPSIQGYILYCEGHHQAGHRLLADSISECKTFGVVSNLSTYYRSVTIKCALRMWEGSYVEHPEDLGLLRSLSSTAITNGDTEGETLFSIPTLAGLLLQDRNREAESWVALLERHILQNTRLFNLIAIHGILAFYYAKIQNTQKSIIYFELCSKSASQQEVAWHPFPVMGCVFAIMALYELLEDDSSPLRSSGSILHTASMSSDGSFRPGNDIRLLNEGNDHHRALTEFRSSIEIIMAPILHLLEHDMLHCVGHPFVCLGDAAKALILNEANPRDGYQRMVRGWDKHKEKMRGMTFIKAYYMSKMCRHGGREGREEYYEPANTLFEKMGMDPLIWTSDESVWFADKDQFGQMPAVFDHKLAPLELPQA